MKNFINQHRFILINLFLLVLFAGILFATPNLIGADVFYHLKITELIQSNGLQTINELPWFQFTSWHQFPADLSLGFHLLLSPFLWIFPAVAAIKIFTVVLLLIFTNFFLYFLKKLKISLPGFWLLALLFISPLFFLRLFIFRPFVISIILALIILYAIHYKKYLLLFLLSIIYYLCYAGWLQIFIIIFIYSIIEWLIQKKLNLKYLLATLAALSLTIVLRPDFPNIIILTFQQVFSLLYLNLLGIGLNVGIEQYPATWFFLKDNFLIYALLLINIPIIASRKLKLDSQLKTLVYALLSVSIFYGLWTLESIRFIEYLVPFSVLLTALCFSLFVNQPKATEFNNLISNLKQFLQKPILKIILLLAFFSLILIPVQRVNYQFHNVPPIKQYQTTSQWLKNNTPQNSTIFHASWDSFPRLFFHNHHNYYLAGMDPAFMYLYNKDLYWLWRNITEKSIACTAPTGLIDLTNLATAGCYNQQQTPQFIAQTIKAQFNAEYIWLNNYCIYQDFKKFLETNPEFFVKMIEADDSSVFKIK